MRKCRRLANKLTIMVCAVLVSVSAFFYAPMDVCAKSVNDLTLSGSYSSSAIPSDFFFRMFFHTDVGSIETDIVSEYVSLSFDYSVTYNFSSALAPRSYSGSLEFGDISFQLFSNIAPANTSPLTTLTHNGSMSVVVGLDDLQKITFFSNGSVFGNNNVGSVSSFSVDATVNLSNVVIHAISSSDSDSYQNGYNAGYTAGEQAGFGNGYSQGFTDGEASVDNDEIYNQGFEAGKDSVDTQSYYDAGYQAGYQVAYQDGYDSGYAEGLKSVQSSPGSWQPFKFVGTNISNVKQYGTPFYVAPYGLDDMEEYASGANGYYHNTVPSVYDGYSTINYIVPFDGVTSLDSNTFRFIMNISNLYSNFDINSGSGSFQNTLTSSEVQEAFITFNGKKYYGNIGKYAGGTQGYVNFDFIVDDVIPPVDLQTNSFLLSFVVHNTLFANINASQYKFVGASCAPYVSFNVGSSAQGYAFRVRSYVENDRTSASIKSQTDTLTDGFNDSHGNSVNNEFSTGLNDFETAEDSLFATATSGMKDFTFFDISSVPAMLTGMSFVGSIMSGWFTQAGGASGVGIVLSILFSIMLVAMVLGLYRWYQSKGGKD